MYHGFETLEARQEVGMRKRLALKRKLVNWRPRVYQPPAIRHPEGEDQLRTMTANATLTEAPTRYPTSA